nr:response regulator transcription factor [Anaerotalea alkaliphila]
MVVDDEFGILEVVQAYLRKEGYEVYTATAGNEALGLFEGIRPDFVVLDLMLPDLSGEEICRRIRERSDVPILMLTAKKEEEDRIRGLELGADDYLTKPFSPKELVMRVKAILRRTGPETYVERDELSFNHGDLVIEKVERVVRKAGQVLDLTRNEYQLLTTFAENVQRTFTREQLIESSFGYDYLAYDRTIDVYVKNLRKKIEDDIKSPVYILTVYGVGYKFKGERDL